MRVMKIDQNLGLVERIVRLVLGLVVAGWVLMQPERSALQWVALVTASFLVLNGVLGRCYLWHWLRLDRRGSCDSVCQRSAAGH